RGRREPDLRSVREQYRQGDAGAGNRQGRTASERFSGGKVMAELEVLDKPTEQEEEREPEVDVRGSRRDQAKSFFRENPFAKWILIGLVAVLVVGGISFWHYYSARESTDDAQIEGDIVPISARVGGTVAKALVDDNQYVEAGTVLVEIDPTDY